VFHYTLGIIYRLAEPQMGGEWFVQAETMTCVFISVLSIDYTGIRKQKRVTKQKHLES